MPRSILVFYGSYRRDRQGIRLADYIVHGLRARGDTAELIDAKVVGLPILDRMHKEYAPGEAPEAMAALAAKIRAADGFVFVTGEYNWGIPPGLKNLTDHYLEEWFWRPAAIACYSAGPWSGVRAMMGWRDTLGEMGMVVTSSILPVGRIGGAFDGDGKPAGDDGARLEKSFPRFADDLNWWIDAAKAQRARQDPPY